MYKRTVWLDDWMLVQFYRQLAWCVTGQAFSLNWSILSTHVAVAETSKWEFVCTAVHRLFPAPAYSGYRNGEQTPNVEGVVCVEFVTAVHIESVPGLKIVKQNYLGEALKIFLKIHWGGIYAPPRFLFVKNTPSWIGLKERTTLSSI